MGSTQRRRTKETELLRVIDATDTHSYMNVSTLFLTIVFLGLVGCGDGRGKGASGQPFDRVLVTVVGQDWPPDRECPGYVGAAFGLIAGDFELGGEGRELDIAVACVGGDAGRVEVRVRVLRNEAGLWVGSWIGDGSVTTDEGASGENIVWAVAGAVHRSMELVAEIADVEKLNEDRLLAILKAPDGHQRGVVLESLDEAGRRSAREGAVPISAIARRSVESGDEEIALRAIGVLGILRDERAIKTLGGLAVVRGAEIPFAAVQALADIGGTGAVKALELSANQTQSEVVARAAREQLLRLTKPKD